MSAEATARASVVVEVTCEACGDRYSYETTLIGLATSWDDSESVETLSAKAAEELSTKIQACQFGRHLGVRKCRKCAHIQSWMNEHRQETRGFVSFFLSMALGLTSILIIRESLFSLGLPTSYELMFISLLLVSCAGYYWLVKCAWAAFAPIESRGDGRALSSRPTKVSITRATGVEIKQTKYY